MNSKISISIPKPCHENWREMTPLEKGRFCDSCQKQVFDFTRSSDRSIIQKINSQKNVCGRLLSSQLERDLIAPKEKSGFWIAGVSGILSFLSLGNQQIFAQEKVNTEQVENKTSTEKNDANFSEDIIISGVVYENTEFPLPRVNIQNKRTLLFTTSDFDGKFNLVVKKGDLIEFTHVGMEGYSEIVTSEKPLEINMIENIQLTGEIIVGGVSLRRTFFGRIFQSIGNIFR